MFLTHFSQFLTDFSPDRHNDVYHKMKNSYFLKSLTAFCNIMSLAPVKSITSVKPRPIPSKTHIIYTFCDHLLCSILRAPTFCALPHQPDGNKFQHFFAGFCSQPRTTMLRLAFILSGVIPGEQKKHLKRINKAKVFTSFILFYTCPGMVQ